MEPDPVWYVARRCCLLPDISTAFSMHVLTSELALAGPHLHLTLPSGVTCQYWRTGAQAMEVDLDSYIYNPSDPLFDGRLPAACLLASYSATETQGRARLVVTDSFFFRNVGSRCVCSPGSARLAPAACLAGVSCALRRMDPMPCACPPVCLYTPSPNAATQLWSHGCAEDPSGAGRAAAQRGVQGWVHVGPAPCATSAADDAHG